jgi:hypothetical protein
MRRQDTSRFMAASHSAQPDDLGWNDWGNGDAVEPSAEAVLPDRTPAAAPVAAPETATKAEAERFDDNAMPQVLRQIEQLAWRINQAVATVPQPDEAPIGRRAAFTLRLDSERHFRLKMATVVLNRSAQVLVTEALDRYLSEIPQVASATGADRAPC